MSSSTLATTPPVDRQDAHNPSVDGDLAELGLCATVHLASGRRCTLAAHHGGCCAFVHLTAQAPVRWRRRPSDLALGCVVGR